MSKLIAHIRARTVVQKAASLLDLDEMDITGDDRDPVLCEVRYAVMRVLADDGYGQSLIGRMLMRAHLTVRNGLCRAYRSAVRRVGKGWSRTVRSRGWG